MENIKQQLIGEIKERIEEVREEIKKSDEEIKIWEAKIKVENRMSNLKDLPSEIAEDVKYSILGLESMLIMEQNRNLELAKDLKILEYREKIVNKMEKEEL